MIGSGGNGSEDGGEGDGEGGGETESGSEDGNGRTAGGRGGRGGRMSGVRVPHRRVRVEEGMGPSQVRRQEQGRGWERSTPSEMEL